MIERARQTFAVCLALNFFICVQASKNKNALSCPKTWDAQDVWRRRWDLNPCAGFPTYSLSRGAPSPLGYFSKMVKYIKSGIINLAERKRFELLVPCGITSFQD